MTNRVAQAEIARLRARLADGGEFDCSCVRCSQSRALLITDDARAVLVDELTDDATPRHRQQELRAMLRVLDAHQTLLLTPAASALAH